MSKRRRDTGPRLARRWLFLLAASAPLAVLTVLSFLALGKIEEPGAKFRAAGEPLARDAAAVAGRNLADLHDARPLWENPAAADLLSGTGLPGAEALATSNPFHGLALAWPRWATLMACVNEYLATYRPDPGADPDALLERKAALQRRRDEVQGYLGDSATELYALLDQATASTEARGGQRRREIAAAKEAGEIEKALDAGDFPRCLSMAGGWQARYANISDPAPGKRVAGVRLRAKCRLDEARLGEELARAADEDARGRLYAAFLETFADGAALGDAERGLVAARRREFEALRARQHSAAAAQTAKAEMEKLRSHPPATLAERVGRAAEILEKHPAPGVREMLRAQAARWLEEALPEPTLREDPRLEEAETKDREIVRGYFKQVAGPPAGYKRFETLAELENPTHDVGTYRFGGKESDLLRPPGPSVPRRAVEHYAQARRAALAQPEKKDSWARLAAACQQVQRVLAEYRRKPGSSQEPFSLEAVERFAQELPSGPAWKTLEKLWQP